MHPQRFGLMIGILSISAGSGQCLAGAVLFAGNGHYYEAFAPATHMTWFEAKAAAESMVFAGRHGHLATIHSAEENAFVRDLAVTARLTQPVFHYYKEFWLGGFQPEGSPEPNSDWRWVTGEAWTYTNWDPPAPDNDTSNQRDEDSLVMLISPVYNIGAGRMFPHTRHQISLSLIAMGTWLSMANTPSRLQYQSPRRS